MRSPSRTWMRVKLFSLVVLYFICAGPRCLCPRAEARVDTLFESDHPRLYKAFGVDPADLANGASVVLSSEDNAAIPPGVYVILDASRISWGVSGYRNLAGSWTEQGGITQDDMTSPSFFGYAFDFDGDFAIVGAHMSSRWNLCDGAAYIYQRDSNDVWNLYQALSIRGSGSNDHFGVSVAIQDNIAVVGAYQADGIGAVYCYLMDKNGVWVLKQKLQPRKLDPGDNFGITLALDGTNLVVGAEGDDDVAADTGAVYVFRGRRGRWSRNGRKLIPDDAGHSDFVGQAVAIDGDWLAVGVCREGSDTGAVYMYKRRGARWLQHSKLTSVDRDAGDLFGCSVSLKNGCLLVGARGDDTSEVLNPGAAYTYRLTENEIWAWESWFTSADPMTDGLFGASVALNDDLAIVGAPGESGTPGDPNNRTGVAYLFQHSEDEWTDLARIAASDGNDDDYFGVATGFDVNTPVVGSPKREQATDFGNLRDLGGVYFFDRCPPADINGDCVVNFLDLGILATQWFSAPTIPDADFAPFDEPGRVDYSELMTLAEQWLQSGVTNNP